MDDNDLEARLRTHLHRRVDNANPSPELVSAVQQVIAAPPRRISPPAVRWGSLRLGWSAVGALLVVAVLAIAGLRIGGLLDPAANPTPSSPTSASPTERQFIVLPPVDAAPTKTESSLAAAVLTARLHAIFGVSDDPGAFTSAVGNAITFRLPITGPSDESIRSVLRAQGELAFVPLPESFTDGTHTAVVGQNLPTDEPVLFGWDGVASAAMDVDQQGRPALTITLRPAAAEAFGDYTAAHQGGAMAVVVDDDVALLPIINEPIPGGQIQLSAGGQPGSAEQAAFVEASAILAGGKLPEAWSSLPPWVPEILQPQELAIGLARELPGVTVESADLDAVLDGRRWVAVWRTQLAGRIADNVCPQLSVEWQGSCPVVDPLLTFTFEAETGELISAEPPET
jgi:hypothetical protein